MQQHTDPAYLQISLNPYAQFHMQDVTTHNHQEVNLTNAFNTHTTIVDDVPSPEPTGASL